MSTATGHGHAPNPGLIFETLNMFQRSAALKSAIELDLFTEIATGKHTAAALAEAVHASIRGVRILCDFLTVIGFLTKQGAEYSLTQDSALFLDRNSPAYFGSAAKFVLDPNLISPFLDLTAVVRKGGTTLPDKGSVSDDNPIWVEFAEAMAPMQIPAAQEIAGLVAGDAPMKVLDIAAGHGVFGIMIAKTNPSAQVTALDWANVLAVAAQNAAKFGVADRHHALPGDAFTAEFGGPYDLILLTNFLHHFDAATCEELIRKVHAALAPGGRCVTLDFIPNDDRVSPAIPASFAMVMLGSTPAGDVYTFAEYEAMFAKAGFSSSQFQPLHKSPGSLVISQK